MLGVVIAQLYRLQHSESPDPKFGYFVLSKPISCIFHVSAIFVAILGSVRFFRQQHAMAIGKIEAGGWEIMIIGVYVLLVSEQRQLWTRCVFVRLTCELAAAGHVLSPCWNYRIQELSRRLVVDVRRTMTESEWRMCCTSHQVQVRCCPPFDTRAWRKHPIFPSATISYSISAESRRLLH
jgi:multisubunit Na+/H+ antiporter MnhG subunit